MLRTDLPALLSSSTARKDFGLLTVQIPWSVLRARSLQQKMEHRVGLDHGRRFHYRAHGQGGRGKVRGREEDHGRLRDDELTPSDARQPCRKTRGSRNGLNG